ncbi:MAG: Txe/YoeB family addiction module toxin [Oscillospiraceae bacterium]|nr:Txe/YoeB family addiction module toxin [Oscillospiraceae bacterium]
MFSLKWSPEAWREYVNLQESDKKAIKKANALLKDIGRNGYNTTLGKPEMLKHDFSGFASVRIDKKNRIIFSVQNDTVVILQCGGHYGDK